MHTRTSHASEKQRRTAHSQRNQELTIRRDVRKSSVHGDLSIGGESSPMHSYVAEGRQT
jgi:hypothetical protein